MKTKTKVSITGYAGYIPKLRLLTSEIAQIWKGGGSGPNKSKSVANFDEDITTMSVEAARHALIMANNPNVGAVFVGSESKPYAVKPTSTIVAQALGIHKTLAADFEFACKAGTEAMQVITGLIGSGMINNGIALGVDTAQGRPGDNLEYTASSGAAAFVLSSENSHGLAYVEASTSFVSDTSDFWRRQGESYPRHLSRFTGDPAYFFHVESSVRTLLEEIDAKPTDGLWEDSRNDEDQIGLSYQQIEEAMNNPKSKYFEKYNKIRQPNLHKMNPIPVCIIKDD